MLESLGHSYDIAADGKTALEAVQAKSYDLILMDCQMPEMDGFDATRAIRALGRRYADLPIIALTAHTTAEDQQRCLACGMSDYLSKPLKKDQLAAKIAQWAAPPQAASA